jgi:hypothetical protein
MQLAGELEAAGYSCAVAAGSHHSVVLGVRKELSTPERHGPSLNADGLLRRSDWYAYLDLALRALAALHKQP